MLNVRRKNESEHRSRLFSGLSIVVAIAVSIGIAGCGTEDMHEDVRARGQTLEELLLEDARTCVGYYDYPQALIDGLSLQLIEELRCMDEGWLEFYEPCREPGCIWPEGPQPFAARPEVLDALREAALAEDDFISIRAAYRDVAMQYFSRWYKENCDSSFPAAAPGNSNHQGGRAVDVAYYNFWWDRLLAVGFEHPLENDNPHFELLGDADFRAESEELKVLGVLAFQQLWNRNNPTDPIAEDGVYGPETKERLGNSPVAGFPNSGCDGVGHGDDATDGAEDGAGDDATDMAGEDAMDGAGDGEGPDLQDVADSSGSDAVDLVDTGGTADLDTNVDVSGDDAEDPDGDDATRDAVDASQSDSVGNESDAVATQDGSAPPPGSAPRFLYGGGGGADCSTTKPEATSLVAAVALIALLALRRRRPNVQRYRPGLARFL